MTRLRVLCALLSVALLIASCGGDSDEPVVLVVKTVSNAQCVPPTITIQSLDRELEAAGIVSGARSCASNGRAYAALCGEPFEYYRLVEVPTSQIALARTIGYKPASEIATVVIPQACP